MCPGGIDIQLRTTNFVLIEMKSGAPNGALQDEGINRIWRDCDKFDPSLRFRKKTWVHGHFISVAVR